MTLGSQISDRIAALPNMGGIVAFFDSVRVPVSPGSNSSQVDAQVWTSEGNREVGKAIVWAGQPKKNPKLKIAHQATLLLEGQKLTLKVEEGTLPQGFSSLRVQVRGLNDDGTTTGWIGGEGVPPLPGKKEILSSKLEGKSHLEEKGMRVQVRLFVQARPSTGPNDLEIVLPRTIVYYGKPENAKVQVPEKIELSNGEGKMTLTFPKLATEAFPGLDLTKVGAKLEGVSIGKGEPRADTDPPTLAFAVKHLDPASFREGKVKLVLENLPDGLGADRTEVELKKKP